ncbi:COQ9 family protein [Alphaproteobacteria bacterium GH1-50]|uniref:COQ9 family protein n=1 Tax=Kangsaoukella pontilimi TaxID=2691042 RepID=A0A7C9IGM3_9RHOB|nr:COQ9 family protein [Kangsaoukella pontilimi]MXQ08444.1 COQ9 family protein [Kangsaoukella pontilimi]
MDETPERIRERLLEAILDHVPFDGWSEAAFRAAQRDCDVTAAEARVICPRGAVDLAVAFHRRADRAMVEAIKAADMSGLRFRDKVAEALWLRVGAMGDREAVRRATALFSLPSHAPEGAKLIWETADNVWTALGDSSRDVNWYTKRATLSGVWASVVLFWLGDESPDRCETRAFIDRRIDDVMRIEKVKAQVRDNPLTRPLSKLHESLFGGIKAPDLDHLADLPGRLGGGPR